ncbi:MAG: hypothetical protein DBX90_16685 [Lentisphaerae bacterium]|nr:MAG: hypothetical protein DBX90_16685 [Lentisphaerota bacterium]
MPKFSIERKNPFLPFEFSYTADDDPAAPYTRLQVSTSGPNRADAAAIRFGPPWQAPLSE